MSGLQKLSAGLAIFNLSAVLFYKATNGDWQFFAFVYVANMLLIIWDEVSK